MRSWDIFCRVVDNFGDVGVCWRLARQLAHERRCTVRLWIDDPATLARIEPGVDASAPTQVIQRIEIRRWTEESPATVQPHQVVIEAFACETPPAFVEAMVAGGRRHAWINLEYLSAERWVEGCHGLPSPHPRQPITRHFFFPGFTSKTGGLLRERDLFARRDAFDDDGGARASWWRAIGVEPPDDGLAVSLFAYANPSAPVLFDAWAAGSRSIVCVVPEGVVRDSIMHFFGRPPAVGECAERGNLRMVAIPFVPQRDFDRLLWSCDFNFVRGEDSFVRAQWAARPFAWHIYPQADNAHRPKLDAFVERYRASMAGPVAGVVTRLFDAWNGEGDVGAAWHDAVPLLDSWRVDARQWSDSLSAQPDLVSRLDDFVETLL